MSSRHMLLALCICVAAYASAELQAEGSLAYLIPVSTGRHSEDSPLRSTEEIALWCQVRDRHGGDKLKIDSAHFTRSVGGTVQKVADAELSADSKNASLTFKDPMAEITKAGRYTCHITAKGQKATGTIQVYARPVLFTSGHGVRYDAREDDEFHFEASAHTVTAGTETETFSCPVFGYPKPTISWKFNGGALPKDVKVSPEGDQIVISNIEKELHEGTYTCEALNSFEVDKQTITNSLTLDRHLHVKHWLSFLIPLGLIVVILILLAIVISLCECRRKKNEQQLLEPVTDE